MFAGHRLHGFRTLVSCAPELRSRYLSNKLTWLYEGRSIQVTLPGVFNFFKPLISASAVLERSRRIHCSAVALSHYRPETPCSTTCGYDTVAEFVMANSSNLCPKGWPYTRWIHNAWFCVGAAMGSHNGGFRGMADRPSLQRVSGHDTRFVESLRLCREYVPYREHVTGGKYMHNAAREKLPVPCTTTACRDMRMLAILNRSHNSCYSKQLMLKGMYRCVKLLGWNSIALLLLRV